MAAARAPACFLLALVASAPTIAPNVYTRRRPFAKAFAKALETEEVRRECPGLRSAPKALRLTRWPSLKDTAIGVTRQWAWWMQNVETVEPLAMAAFLGAIQARKQVAVSSVIIDIGANMGARENGFQLTHQIAA